MTSLSVSTCCTQRMSEALHKLSMLCIVIVHDSTEPRRRCLLTTTVNVRECDLCRRRRIVSRGGHWGLRKISFLQCNSSADGQMNGVDWRGPFCLATSLFPLTTTTTSATIKLELVGDHLNDSHWRIHMDIHRMAHGCVRGYTPEQHDARNYCWNSVIFRSDSSSAVVCIIVLMRISIAAHRSIIVCNALWSNWTTFGSLPRFYARSNY